MTGRSKSVRLLLSLIDFDLVRKGYYRTCIPIDKRRGKASGTSVGQRADRAHRNSKAGEEGVWLEKARSVHRPKGPDPQGLAGDEKSRVIMLYTRDETIVEQSGRPADGVRGGCLPMFIVQHKPRRE